MWVGAEKCRYNLGFSALMFCNMMLVIPHLLKLSTLTKSFVDYKHEIVNCHISDVCATVRNDFTSLHDAVLGSVRYTERGYIVDVKYSLAVNQ